MNDTENNPTLKTKENTCCFLQFMFSLLRVFKNKLVCEFSKHQNAVFLFKYIMNRHPVLVHKSVITDIKKVDATNDAASSFKGKLSSYYS